jgi:hypothetical protein
MKVLVLLAALGLTSPAFAATITVPKPPTKPTPPTVSLQDSQKTTPGPAKEPVLFDSIRRLLGPEKSAPKSGAGPGIG